MISVSIIVGVYNSERYLKECLDSLVNQTMQAIEIILVNDASTDNSLELLRRYENEYPNISVINHDSNKKLGGARNTGLKAAQGEYIIYIDSDDKIEQAMCEKLYTKAKETNADIVDCDYYNWYPGSQDRLKPKRSIDTGDCGVLDKEKRARLLLRGGPVHMKLYKRQLLLENDIFFPEGIFYEDVAIASLCYMYADILEKVPEHLYYYRHDNVSITRADNSYQNWEDRFKALSTFADNYEKRGFYQEYKDEVDARFIRVFYIESINLILKQYEHKFHKSILAFLRKYIKDNYPGYRKNPYFKMHSRNAKIRTLLCDISPLLMIAYDKICSFCTRFFP